MRWKNLKYWQKAGIIFGGLHIIILLFLLLTSGGKGEGVVLLAILLEWPLVLLTGDYLPPILKNNIFFVCIYLLVIGTLTYAIIGMILSIIIMKPINFLLKVRKTP